MQIHEIQRAVAEAFGIPEGAMTSPQKKREWSRPRQVAYYLCYDEAGYSLPRIAAAFKRDHSTVYHGVQVIRHLRANPLAFQNSQSIERAIRHLARCIRNYQKAELDAYIAARYPRYPSSAT